MRDYDKFVESLDYYLENKLKENENNTSLSDKFYDEIKDLRCEDFRFHYRLASCQNFKGNIDDAKKNIDKSINIFESLGLEGLGKDPCKENGFIVIVKEKGTQVKLPPINRQLFDIYYLAGEIYGKKKLFQDSLKYYKIANYYGILLKSDFEEDYIELYSFRKYNTYTLNDLINGEITVSPSTKMNDPFDSLINIWASKENLSELSNGEHIESLSKSFELFRIRSFCKGNKAIKNILMWSHYADEHRGFCVKYKFSKYFIKRPETNEYKHMYLKKINYRDEKIDLKSHSINTDLAFAKKDKCWEYEDEVRLISYDLDNDKEFQQIPLDKESKIEAIYFGCNCPDKDKQTIYNIISKMYDYKIQFYNMKKDFGDVYNLKIEGYKQN